jgi:alpha-N-arabinofuranosidase
VNANWGGAVEDDLPGRIAQGEVLTAPRVDSPNRFAEPVAVVPHPLSGRIKGGALTLTLPAKSVAVIKIR